MPYINESDRKRALSSPRTVGELNYAITIMAQQFMDANGGLSYARINDVMGVLESSKQEFYRRVAIPYEDKAIARNGDVYVRDYAQLPHEAMLEKAMMNVAAEPKPEGGIHVHVSTAAERRERTTVRMMPAHLREKFSQPPRSEQPQRDVPTLVRELGGGKPLSEALERALVRRGEGDALAYHNDSAHGGEFPLARSHFDHPKAG